MRGSQLLPIILWLFLPVSGFTSTFYVSPEGKTAAAGTQADPFPSLTAARDAVRKLRIRRPSEPITVYLRAGRYELSETLIFTPADSGSSVAPIVYSGYPHELPIVTGGRRITGWKLSGGRWNTTVTGTFHQLFIAGTRATRARTPNFGYYRVEGLTGASFRFRGNDIPRTLKNSGAEIVELLDWAQVRRPLLGVDELAHTALDPHDVNHETDARYHIENAASALDRPGEWFHDEATGLLQYIPLPGDDLARDEVTASSLPELIHLEGDPAHARLITNITFRGIMFRETEWTMPKNGYLDSNEVAHSAIVITGGQSVTIEHCTFSQLGGFATYLSYGSRDNSFLSNEVFDAAGGGIKIGEGLIQPERFAHVYGNTVSGNHFHNLGVVFPTSVGVLLAQSGFNTVSHNSIHDMPYNGIFCGYTWGYEPNLGAGNIIEFNHIFNIGLGTLSDLAAIYTLGSQPGGVIRNNVIHDVTCFRYGAWGIYLDAGSSHLLIENNIVYRTGVAGFFVHFGRGNTVRNNVFAGGGEAQIMRGRPEEHLTLTATRNIFYFDSGTALGGEWSGTNFRFDNNLYWDTRGGAVRYSGRTRAEWRAEDQDVHSLVADPLFTNPGNGDFTLGPGSPALSIGFVPIATATVGPLTAPGAQVAAR